MYKSKEDEGRVKKSFFMRSVDYLPLFKNDIDRAQFGKYGI